MLGDSIPIPRERIEPMAKAVAGNKKNIAAVFFMLAAVFLFAAIGMSMDRRHKHMDMGEMIGGFSFWLLILSAIGAKFIKGAKRAAQAGELAKNDPGYTWFLSGQMIVAADPHGTPRPDLSFKISPKLRTMLTAVPRAEVVRRDPPV